MAFPDRFYPVVESLFVLKRVIGLGATSVQLRMKGLGSAEALQRVSEAAAHAHAAAATLVVNDYWSAAIEAKAPYVHLGQDDLARADLRAIRAAGLKLGLSTHNERELEMALACKPDYIAFGPVFRTATKVLQFSPQGVERIAVWKNRIGKIPLVAIGGITLERAEEVLAAGADSIAVIGDIANHADPDARAREWLAKFPGARTR